MAALRRGVFDVSIITTMSALAVVPAATQVMLDPITVVASKVTVTLALAGSTQRGENLTEHQPLVKIYPEQLATTLGARFLDRKVTVAVRWLAVAAKEAKDIPAGSTALPTDGFDVVNIYVDYKPSEDVILAFGVDNLFNEYYVRYLDLRTQGSNSLVPSPSPGVTFKGSLKVRFGDEFFRRG